MSNMDLSIKKSKHILHQQELFCNFATNDVHEKDKNGKEKSHAIFCMHILIDCQF